MKMIPDPIFLEILDYLPLWDLLKLRRTNSGLNQLLLKEFGGPVAYTVKDLSLIVKLREKQFRIDKVSFRGAMPIIGISKSTDHWPFPARYYLENHNQYIREAQQNKAYLVSTHPDPELRMWQGFPFY